MTIPLDTALTLLATAAGLVFLSVCAWHNQKSGFRKVRHAESPVDDAILWLAALKDTLDNKDDKLSEEEIALVPRGVPSPLGMISATEQLLSLHTALRQQETPCVAVGEEVAALKAA